MSLSGWGDFLQGLGSVGQAIAIGLGGYYATQSFKGWRHQTLSARKIEQAERILTATYNSVEALYRIRDQAITDAERSASLKNIRASIEVDEALLRSDVIQNRVKAEEPIATELNKCKPMAKALFGDKVVSAISALHIQFMNVNAAAVSLAYPDHTDNFLDQLESILSSNELLGRSNKTSSRIRASVKTIEDECLPVLKL